MLPCLKDYLFQFVPHQIVEKLHQSFFAPLVEFLEHRHQAPDFLELYNPPFSYSSKFLDLRVQKVEEGKTESLEQLVILVVLVLSAL